MAIFGFKGFGRRGNTGTSAPAPSAAPTPHIFVPGIGWQAVGDSGMVTNAPMAKRNPGALGLIRRFIGRWLRMQDIPDPGQTSEAGSAGAASPSTYQQSLYTLRYERRAVITDCRLMYHEDSRCFKAVNKYAREATRGGVNITFSDSALDAAGEATRKQAQEIVDDITAIVNPRLKSWAAMTLVEGELFVQCVIDNRRVVSAKRMPAVSIERLSDDTDEFQNPGQAFEQIDVQTDQHIAYFSLGLMYHLRWNHIDGERYGWPEIATGRRQRRNLDLLEESQKIRRMTRASKRTLWKIGSAEATVTQAQINEFRETNGMVAGKVEPLDPMNIPLNYFGNHLVTTESIGGDEAMSDIADIEYAQNNYANAALPTPAAIYGLESKNVNRDVLEDQRSEWLKETATMSDELAKVVRWLVETALLLAGRLPETLPFEVSFSESSLETASEIAERVIKLRGNTIGTGATAEPDPLISKKTALRILAKTKAFDDVEQELADIDAEIAERRDQKRQQAEKDSDLFKRIGPGGGTSAPPNPNPRFQNAQELGPLAARNGVGSNRYRNGGKDLANAGQ